MLNSPVIRIENLSKIYKLYNAPIDRLKEAFNPFKKSYHHDFYALRDISFEVGRGEILGLIGRNGSGKSTILQIICGVLTPSAGTIAVNGKISALLELGAGFNPELTGLENVYFKSSILGNSKQETDSQIDEILSFADIGEFIDQPVKTYSSGMFIRLAFAVAVNVNPEILVVDEALSVGDFRFRQKCLRRIKQFQQDGKTILFVSHDTGTVTEFCTRAIWLLDGKVQMDGRPAKICKNYISYMSFGQTATDKQNEQPVASPAATPRKKAVKQDINWIDTSNCSSFGKKKAEIKRISFYNASSLEQIYSFEGGERVILALEIYVHEDINRPIAGFLLGDTKGIHVLGMNSKSLKKNIQPFRKGEVNIVKFEFDFPFLKVGEYAISPALAELNEAEEIIQHHWVHDAHLLRIASSYEGAQMGHFLIIKDNFDIHIEVNAP
ncbi:ABC transporter ATP-binding protein [Desulfobacterota bacterium M19]